MDRRCLVRLFTLLVVLGGLAGCGGTGSNSLSGAEGTFNVTRDNATVGGGSHNSAGAYHATVGGGSYNSAGVEHSTVAGGVSNIASATRASIGGGYANMASMLDATVGGGSANSANGTMRPWVVDLTTQPTGVIPLSLAAIITPPPLPTLLLAEGRATVPWALVPRWQVEVATWPLAHLPLPVEV